MTSLKTSILAPAHASHTPTTRSSSKQASASKKVDKDTQEEEEKQGGGVQEDRSVFCAFAHLLDTAQRLEADLDQKDPSAHHHLASTQAPSLKKETTQRDSTQAMHTHLVPQLMLRAHALRAGKTGDTSKAKQLINEAKTRSGQTKSLSENRSFSAQENDSDQKTPKESFSKSLAHQDTPPVGDKAAHDAHTSDGTNPHDAATLTSKAPKKPWLGLDVVPRLQAAPLPGTSNLASAHKASVMTSAPQHAAAMMWQQHLGASMRVTKLGGTFELNGPKLANGEEISLQLHMIDGATELVCEHVGVEPTVEVQRALEDMRKVLARAGLELEQVTFRSSGGDKDSDHHSDRDSSGRAQGAHLEEQDGETDHAKYLDHKIEGVVHVVA